MVQTAHGRPITGASCQGLVAEGSIGSAQGPLLKTPETQGIAQKLGFGGVLGETASPKHVLDTVQSIWDLGFPEIWVGGIHSCTKPYFSGVSNPREQAQAWPSLFPIVLVS